MIPFVLSLESYVLGEEGVPDNYTYTLQYFGKMYYINLPMDWEEMSVLERQHAVLGCFGEAFTQEQEEKLGERPSDIQDLIDETIAEYGLDEDDDEDEDDYDTE